jgi:hypothetical protein
MGYAFENYYSGEFENHQVEIFLGRDLNLDILTGSGDVVPGVIRDTQMYITIEINGAILKEDTVYGDLVAGEFLRDAIGYGPAKDMLTRMKLPENSLMWRLGRKG